jgi:hypothetical protein
MALARKLGMGNDEGAGEAWNVAPAKAVEVGGFTDTVFGGVLRFCLAGAGDGGACPDFARGLFPFRGFDLVLTSCEVGTGLFAPDFWGVAKGLPVPLGNSMGNGRSDGISLSEAYDFMAGERVDGGRFWRRRPGVVLRPGESAIWLWSIVEVGGCLEPLADCRKMAIAMGGRVGATERKDRLGTKVECGCSQSQKSGWKSRITLPDGNSNVVKSGVRLSKAPGGLRCSHNCDCDSETRRWEWDLTVYAEWNC